MPYFPAGGSLLCDMVWGKAHLDLWTETGPARNLKCSQCFDSTICLLGTYYTYKLTKVEKYMHTVIIATFYFVIAIKRRKEKEMHVSRGTVK